jgi:phage repressor protein C with HTH and peptisase S24 domain
MKTMNIKMTRLYEAARAAGKLTGDTDQAELARLLNESPQTIHNWETRGLSKQGALTAQSVFGVNATWLNSGTGDMFVSSSNAQFSTLHSTTKKNEHEIVLSHYETGGSMGGGVELRDQPGVIQSWNVNQEWLQKNVKGFSSAKHLYIVTGFGDSMRPIYNPGDPVIVDTSIRSVEFDGIYFFRVGNEGFIKRLQRIPGEGIAAISENKAYREWIINDSMDFEVFGRVLKAWKSEDF